MNWRWGRVPVITVLGALSFAACGFMAWVYLVDPLSGLSVVPHHTGGLFGYQAFAMFILNIVIWVSGWFVYMVAKKIRARQGWTWMPPTGSCRSSSESSGGAVGAEAAT